LREDGSPNPLHSPVFLSLGEPPNIPSYTNGEADEEGGEKKESKHPPTPVTYRDFFV
jgi:hypothetical protein